MTLEQIVKDFGKSVAFSFIDLGNNKTLASYKIEIEAPYIKVPIPNANREWAIASLDYVRVYLYPLWGTDKIKWTAD